MIIVYVISVIIIISLLLRAYFKLSHPFWYKFEGSYLRYNLYDRIFNNGVKINDFTGKIKYYDKKIIAKHINDCDEDFIKDFTEIVKTHYFSSDSSKYSPNTNNLLPYLNNNNLPSYICIYYEDAINKIPVGCISSKPLNFQIDKFKYYGGYIDFLCVHKDYRKKNIASKLIHASQYLNMSPESPHYDKQIKMGMFKRENVLNNHLVPLVKMDLKIFNSYYWNQNKIIDPNFEIILIDKSNFDLLQTFFNEEINKYFDCLIFPDFSNILELINSKNYFIYLLKQYDRIHGIYIFKDSCTTYTNKRCIECIAVIKTDVCNEKNFIKCFYNIANSFRNIFTYIQFETISHNEILIKDILKHTYPYINTISAWYLYNYIHKSIKNNKVMIIY